MPHWWMWVGTGVLLAVLSFVMTPPNWLVDKWVRRFALHRQLLEDEVNFIRRGHEVLTGALRAQVITDFNQAVFLNQYDILPVIRNQIPLMIDAHHGATHERYKVYKNPPFIDVFRETDRKTVAYRVESASLAKRLTTRE